MNNKNITGCIFFGVIMITLGFIAYIGKKTDTPIEITADDLASDAEVNNNANPLNNNNNGEQQ